MDSFEQPALATRSPGEAGRRREIRLPVDLLGTLTTDGGAPAFIQVADLSRGGACCRTAEPVHQGCEVDLRLDNLSARAIVCWTAAGRLGLRFVEPLRASDLLIQSGRSRAGGLPPRPLHREAAARLAHRAG